MVRMRAALVILVVAACGTRPHKGEGAMPSDVCHDVLNKLLAKDLVTWTGLPATCTLASLTGVEIGTDEQQALLGDDRVTTAYRNARAPAFRETLKVWLRDGKITRISVKLPDLADPPALLAKLGPPEAKLDAWFATTPDVNQEGEWVYAKRGLALVMSTNRQNIMELIVYPPTTPDAYRKQLRYSERPRELE
jgi:hypothetical protein